ncbi:MAG: hypothetical protein EBT28_01645 [Betaproteobacteria bacterium]|nr:hypothetical protein [Betaproteobacteria bacterium]
MLKLLLIFISCGILLTGCASHSTQAIGKLDNSQPIFHSNACKNARNNAWVYQEAKDAKLWAGPSAFLIAGPIAFIPVLFANATVNAADHLKAADIASNCGGNPPNPEAVAGDIALDATLDIATGSLIPAALPLKSAP